MKISVNKAFSHYISLSIIILLFQSLISAFLPVASYYDEFFELSLICIFLFRKNTIDKKNFIVLVLILFTIVVGIIGNFKSKYNLSFIPMTIDTIVILKPFVAIIAMKELCDSKIVKDIYCNIKVVLELYILLAVALYVPLYFIDRNNAFSQVRFGMPSYAFIAGNPGILGINVAEIIAFLSLKDGYYSSFKGKMILIMGLLLCLSTTKGSCLVFVVVLLFLMFLMGRKIRIWQIIVAIIVILGVSQYQIKTYIKDITSPRSLLLNTGINLAKEFFPLGTGLGTFGNQVSYDYYSPIYYKTGLAYVWGLRPQDNAMFINDNYWPMLMAQFGYIGAAIFLGIYIYFFVELNKMIDKYKLRKKIFIALFATLMYMSLASAYITGTIGELGFLVIGLYIALF
ncbi:hypothetical protein [Lactobacillus delbrueckii]|uniref:hypothetical protein n=1 Tax=Lactobacillus delbrueckii TaxID=1584 RepID=UPI0022EC06E0|nr:hypothetical protein [Lactobacillus delbrueckii]MDA3797252.1 hypothetical protein [Lactobacillus delbrueckii]